MLGLFIGLPLGILVNYALGFPTLPNLGQVPSDFWGWVIILSSWMGSVVSSWFTLTAILWFLFYKREGLISSWHDIGKIIWGLFICFPVMFGYTILVFSAFFVPLEYATPWLSSVKRWALGLLLFFPFVFLFFVIFLPDQKPRKLLIRFWLVISGKMPIPRLNLEKVVSAFLIFCWLVVVFLPLPESFLTHLVVIWGGLAVLAYLMLKRWKEKRRR